VWSLQCINKLQKNVSYVHNVLFEMNDYFRWSCLICNTWCPRRIVHSNSATRQCVHTFWHFPEDVSISKLAMCSLFPRIFTGCYSSWMQSKCVARPSQPYRNYVLYRCMRVLLSSQAIKFHIFIFEVSALNNSLINNLRFSKLNNLRFLKFASVHIVTIYWNSLLIWLPTT